METVRICLAGAGRAGLVHGRNFAHAIPQARVVAVVDPQRPAREAAASELGCQHHFSALEEALESVAFDAVVVATPTFTHRDLVIRAAQAGRHVLCEKPLALDLEQAAEMARAVERSGILFQMGFMRRFDEEFVGARSLIESGQIGDVVFIRSTTRGPGLPPRWAWDTAKSNGMLAEVNSHDFDTVRWLTGSEYRSVFARARARKALDVAREFPDFYDVAVVCVEMESEALGTIDGACPADYGYDARVEVLGTRGLLTVGAVAQGTLLRCTREGQVVGSAFRSWRDRHRGGYLEEDRHFVECILRGQAPRVGIADGLRALEAVLAARRSLATGGPVPVQRAPGGSASGGVRP